MSDDLYLKAYWDANEAGCARTMRAAAAILRERFIPRVTGPHDGLIERLEAEHSRNGGQGAYAWQSRELCGKAAAAIAGLQAELAEAREALVQHNDRLRSAQMIASRDGADTNWMTFRGQVAYTLAEYHELVNECRQALEATNAE